MKPILTKVKGSRFIQRGKEIEKKIIFAKKYDLPDIDTPIFICDQKTLDVLHIFFKIFEQQIKDNANCKQFLNENLTVDQIKLIQEVRKDVLFT